MRARIGVLLAALVCSGCAERFDVDGARMMADVERQVAAGPRVTGTPGHAQVRDWIASTLDSLGARVERQSFMDTTLGDPLSLTNVIGRFGPSHGRRVLMCAHYDTRPWADMEPDSAKHSRPIAGANDAGSGVAVLLELARLMRARPPEVGVDLVFFDAEDLGKPSRPETYSLGARGYARRLPPVGDASRPVAGFLFDMVGDRDLNVHVERISSDRAQNLTRLVLDAARAVGATHFHPDVRYEIIDDHVPLLDAGLPTVDIIDFDYPAWHTLRDTPDQLSGESLAEVARVAAWIIYRSPLSRP